MPVDLRRRYDEVTRREAAALFESGLGYGPAARKLGIPKDTVREWLFTYRAMGLKGLLSMGPRQARYTFEQKCDAARAVVDRGATISDAMAAYGIASRTPLRNWCAAYREGGAEALRAKPRGRPKGSGGKPPAPRSREQELEDRDSALISDMNEAENAYLKKLGALRAEETLRTGSRPRW